MESSSNLSAQKENTVLWWYIAFLEGWIMAKDGRPSLDLVREEFYMRLRDLDITENPSPSQKSASA